MILAKCIGFSPEKRSFMTNILQLHSCIQLIHRETDFYYFYFFNTN